MSAARNHGAGEAAALGFILGELKGAMKLLSDNAEGSPISSAPLDGTFILADGEPHGYGLHSPRDWAPRLAVIWFEEGEWRYAYYDSGYYGKWKNPSRWWPIPQPKERAERHG